MRVWLVLLLGVAGAAGAGDIPNGNDALAWLKKMAAASRQLNYTGTIVYQHHNHVETSRVSHYVNSAGGELEKLETLDGPPREVIRSNDQVTCYLPSAKTVLIEERNRNARNFPALVPEQLGGLSENYTVRKGEVDRVAGFDCQWILLEPHDAMRYGRRFCAELGSGLPLRAQTLNEKNEPLESFAFGQLELRNAFNRDALRSKWAERSKTQNWRVERSGYNAVTSTPAETGWIIASQPPGFRKVMEARRSIGGRTASVAQIVLSDGLSAVSVFIEPNLRESKAPSLWQQGAVNIYTRQQGNHTVTVLGEAPAATLMQISNSLEQKPTTASLQ